MEDLGVEEEGDEHGEDGELVCEDVEECAEGVAPSLPPTPTMSWLRCVIYG